MQKEQPLVTLPLSDLVWNILGDDLDGAMCSKITKTTAIVLDNLLKDSTRWKVEFENKEGEPLEYPILWRYSEWKSSNDTYLKARLYEHNRRVEKWMLETNVNALAKCISRMNRMPIETAQPIALSIIKKGNMEVFAVFGLNKIVTKEEEL